MKRTILLLLTIITLPCLANANKATSTLKDVSLSPANGAMDVNIDTHLTLKFDSNISMGNSGCIKIYDMKDGKLVDKLDISIPSGPVESQPKNPTAIYTPVPYIYKSENITNRNTVTGTPSGAAKKAKGNYQLNIIGGFSDAFHFYPIIVHGNTATIYLHNNMLDYDHTYSVIVDDGVISGFKGIKGRHSWTFTTKKQAPLKDCRTLTVAANGSGDFSTLQGAMDYIPDFMTDESQRITVKVKNGNYEELVYFRNKRFVTIEGESRDSVLIHYPNNEVFNPHPSDIKTNELRGTFPSRRAAVAADNCENMIFRNLTLRTDCKGQAEGFLINGEHNMIDNVHVIGDGDALQANGSAYWLNCIIKGGGDTILGRGPSFFCNCDIFSYGAFMWIRNTKENHGNVFWGCRFHGLSDGAVIARLPDNKGKNYPYAEAVLLNCTLTGIPAIGWNPIDSTANHIRLLEFNSHDANGNAIDTSARHPASRQLDAIRDAEIIGQYSNASFVLK